MQTLSPAVVCPRCGTVRAGDESKCRACGNKLTRFSESAKLPWILTKVVFSIPFLLLCVVVFICYGTNRSLRQSDAYKHALSIAASNAEVQSILGSNIHPESSILGHLARLRGTGFAEWSVVLAGSKGTGHLYGIANEVNGVLEYSRLIFKSASGNQKVNLAPIRRLSLPRVPAKHVYLLPLGLADDESLDWAPDYFKSKLGIDVTILPPTAVPLNLVDKRRNQLDAYRCLHEFLQEEDPQRADDPSALIVAVTSQDMYISTLDWRYAENYRAEGRFAVVSSARLHTFAPLERMNPEWFPSRVQKLITKNIVMLYFNLPLSSDYSSLLSGGILSGSDIDCMGGDIIGGERRWDPFIESGSPAVTIYDTPGKQFVWNRKWAEQPLPDPTTQVFTVALDVGLIVQRKADFVFSNDPAMQFTRVYRNQDDRSRAFGIGGSHSFDMFLGGKMGVAVDLIMADGYRVHCVHQTSVMSQGEDIYLPTGESRGKFTEAVYSADLWKVKSRDGWTYLFPYKPNALPQYVTVLTSFLDPAQRRYEMQRDPFGALLEIKSPYGNWLRFENDSEHRIRKITASSGNSMQYDYHASGSMQRATATDRTVDLYSYDSKGQMLNAAHRDGKPILTNQYFVDGFIKSQTLADSQSFEYHYSRQGGRILNAYITDPNRLETYIQFQRGGYREWLPTSFGR